MRASSGSHSRVTMKTTNSLAFTYFLYVLLMLYDQNVSGMPDHCYNFTQSTEQRTSFIIFLRTIYTVCDARGSHCFSVHFILILCTQKHCHVRYFSTFVPKSSALYFPNLSFSPARASRLSRPLRARVSIILYDSNFPRVRSFRARARTHI